LGAGKDHPRDTILLDIPYSYAMLCKFCNNIPVQILSDDCFDWTIRESPLIYEHHKSWKDLLTAASDGCGLCSLVRDEGEYQDMSSKILVRLGSNHRCPDNPRKYVIIFYNGEKRSFGKERDPIVKLYWASKRGMR